MKKKLDTFIGTCSLTRTLSFILLGIAAFFLSCQPPQQDRSQENTSALPITFVNEVNQTILSLEQTQLAVEIVGKELDVPWDIAYGPDGWIWMNEQKGRVSRLNPETGEKRELLHIPDVHYRKSRGLLSLELSPKWQEESAVFLHYTFSFKDEQFQEHIYSRLVKYQYVADEDTLVSPTILLDSIPGTTYHNGSRMLFLPDQTLLLSTGDAGNKPGAQDLSFLGGKMLRMNMDGSVPIDNPIPGSFIYSWGHRNIQGIAYGKGYIYASEHGPNNDDEVNLIRAGENYGWPNVEGYCDQSTEQDFCADSQVVAPLMAWSPTLAISGMAYYNHPAIPEWQHSLLAVNLKARALRVLSLSTNGLEISRESIFLQKVLGRMRDVCVAPNGDVYLATSNNDWHPRLQAWLYDTLPGGPDIIVRLSPMESAQIKRVADHSSILRLAEEEAFDLASETWSFTAMEDDLTNGQQAYLQHCASCHRPDGLGAEGLIPPLAETDWVTGDKTRLIQIVLNGLSDPIEVKGRTYHQEMPAYQHISNNDLADILTYIRTAFGNEAGAIRPEEIQEERRAKQVSYVN